MKAAVLQAPGDLSVREVDDPVCPPGGLLIEVGACAVCASDLKMIRQGHRDLTYPRILGHEVAGAVIETDVEGFREGDRVQVWPGLVCGTCPACSSGHDNLCPEQGILGFNCDGGFAQLMAVPAESVRGIARLPPSLPFQTACLAEPLACCVHAQDACGVGELDTVLIAGAGPMGLLHLMLARSRGARVVVSEPDEARRRGALALGADAVVDPANEDVAEVTLSASPGGADVAILATPTADIPSIFRAMAPLGRMCVFSGLPPGGGAELNLVHYRELTLVGAYGCTSASDHEAVRLIASGEVAAERLITMETSLDRITEGLRHAERREGLKCVVTKF